MNAPTLAEIDKYHAVVASHEAEVHQIQAWKNGFFHEEHGDFHRENGIKWWDAEENMHCLCLTVSAGR